MATSKNIDSIKNITKFLQSYAVADNGCWEWTGKLSEGGYGIFYENRNGKTKKFRAHRVMWFLEKGKLVEGMVIDHICRNRKCVNVEHLREVTNTINALENSFGAGAINLQKTHCVAGHLFSDENTLRDVRGNRACLRCKKEYANKMKERKNAKVSDLPIGVMHSTTGKYISTIKIQQRCYYLGTFECPIEAHEAYKKIHLEWYGNLNFKKNNREVIGE